MTTYTYAVLKISKAAYDEIREKLVTAGYEHAIHSKQVSGEDTEVIDMHGIAVSPESAPTNSEKVCHCGLGPEDHTYPGAAEHAFTPNHGRFAEAGD